MSKRDTEFGRCLIAAMKEVAAHQRGEIVLPSRTVLIKAPATKQVQGPVRNPNLDSPKMAR